MSHSSVSVQPFFLAEGGVDVFKCAHYSSSVVSCQMYADRGAHCCEPLNSPEGIA